tara:strand:- start:280 stop:456 length:177 start_codon:yes stop_codon:yes gene_type:complete
MELDIEIFDKDGKALNWWGKLTKSKQRDYEMQMFGYGEWWEDNSLHNEDIIKMFQHYA